MATNNIEFLILISFPVLDQANRLKPKNEESKSSEINQLALRTEIVSFFFHVRFLILY